MGKTIKQSYAWRYYAGENGSVFVNFAEWPKDYFEQLFVGSEITAQQGRYFGVVGDTSETLENCGPGNLRLTMRMGEGCYPQIHELEA